MPAELSVGLREDSKYEAAVAGITSAVTRAHGFAPKSGAGSESRFAIPRRQYTVKDRRPMSPARSEINENYSERGCESLHPCS